MVDAAENLDQRLLVLLWVRKAEPTSELVELLGSGRAETTAALGRLAQAGLVSHHRPEDEPTHWFATPRGKAAGEQLHRAITASLAAGPAAQTAPQPETAPPDHERVKTRRRVSIDQNEKTGFSWDT